MKPLRAPRRANLADENRTSLPLFFGQLLIASRVQAVVLAKTAWNNVGDAPRGTSPAGAVTEYGLAYRADQVLLPVLLFDVHGAFRGSGRRRHGALPGGIAVLLYQTHRSGVPCILSLIGLPDYLRGARAVRRKPHNHFQVPEGLRSRQRASHLITALSSETGPGGFFSIPALCPKSNYQDAVAVVHDRNGARQDASFNVLFN
ncbi:MAG: hypothetical protein IPO58_02200 [Betaproteobacteria bacterium]|nr:hypothetical protein [Betaproteobacteria bacterium]